MTSALASERRYPQTAGTARLRSVRSLWSWPIAAYLFLAGLGAGGFLVGVAARGLGVGGEPVVRSVAGIGVDLSALALLWGPLAVAAGAPFLILDLGRKARFFRAGGNPRSSWMARGFYILIAFILVGGAASAVAALAPAWPAAHAAPWRALLGAAALLALGTAVYTGLLLRSLRFVPVWNSYVLPVLFLASALSTGAMGVILASAAAAAAGGSGAAALAAAVHPLARAEQVLILMEGGALAAHLLRVRGARAGGGDSVRMLVSGRLRYLFWGGVVAAGLVFPGALELLYQRWPDSTGLLWAAGGLLLVGGFLLRLGLLAAAVKEELPLQRLLEARAHARVLRVDV